jgi:hypothetical protein
MYTKFIADLHEDARRGDAALAAVGKEPDHGNINGLVHVAVVINDQRRLAAELEGDPLEVALG